MSVELTEAEKALLPYMTNDLYEKNHSVIATLFPVRHIVGQRLVDNGLLTSTEYLEICSSPENVAGSRLICSLNRKGDDSMATFYKVLASAKGDRGVDSILRCLEAAAERKRKEVSHQAGRTRSSNCIRSQLCICSCYHIYPLIPVPGSTHTAQHKETACCPNCIAFRRLYAAYIYIRLRSLHGYLITWNLMQLDGVNAILRRAAIFIPVATIPLETFKYICIQEGHISGMGEGPTATLGVSYLGRGL